MANENETRNEPRSDLRENARSDPGPAPITPTAIQPNSKPVTASEVAPGSDNKADTSKTPVANAPFTAEDPSRSPPPSQAASSPNFPGYPKTKYHPVYGARTAKDPNDEATVFTPPPHNWFDTAGEADAHRTDREAQMVVHNNRRVKVDAALARQENADHETDRAVATGDAGVVRNSVAATESVKSGNVEPL